MTTERTGNSLDTHESTRSSRYEPSDVPALLPFWLACLLASFIASVLIGITLGYPLADAQQFKGPLQRLPPAPRLQVAPASELTRYEADKKRELEPTGGVSITAAMEETAKQGWGAPK